MIIPSLPDAHLVRTYSKDYADTDTESEREAQFEVDWDDEARLQKDSGKKQPSFISGYIDGQPLYTNVRVVPKDVVSRIEDKIALQEKMEYQQQASETFQFYIQVIFMIQD